MGFAGFRAFRGAPGYERFGFGVGGHTARSSKPSGPKVEGLLSKSPMPLN